MPADDSAEAAQRVSPPRVRHRWAWIVPHLAFAVLAVVMVAWLEGHHPMISPIDETSHLDYIERAPDVPGSGARLGQDAMHEWACRGFPETLPWEFPPCDTERFDPASFPGGAYSYSGSTPPLYYWVTALVTRPVAAVTGLDVFELARLFGAGWLTALMSLSYLLALRLGAPRMAAFSAALLTGSSAAVVTSAATVGPDVATAAAGGLVVLAAMGYDGSRRSLLLLLGATAVAAATKLTAFPAVGAAMFVLVLGAVRPAGDEGASPSWPLRKGLGAAGVTFAVFGVLSAAWGLVYKSRELVDPAELSINSQFQADHLDWGRLWEFHLFPFLTTTTQNWLPPAAVDIVNDNVALVIAGLHIVALIALACAYREERRAGALGIGALVLAVTGPFILILLNFYVNGQSFTIVTRYGYALLPVYAAAAAWLCRDRAASRALALLALVSVVNVLT